MSEGIATFKNVSMGSLCDPRKHEEILNDLWVEWVKLVLELELENAVRRRFPGHSAGSYGRLARWIDELGFIASDVRFLVETLWRAIVSWPNWRNLQWWQRVNKKPAGESAVLQESLNRPPPPNTHWRARPSRPASNAALMADNAFVIAAPDISAPVSMRSIIASREEVGASPRP
jgi:hypothetical protein